MIARALALAVPILAGCGEGSVSNPLGPSSSEAARTLVELELAEDLPTFKVDGVIRLSYRLGDPFVGETIVGTIVLPAGRRTVADTLGLPPFAGRLVARERTFSPAVPFLCGEAGVGTPGTAPVDLVLRLCFP